MTDELLSLFGLSGIAVVAGPAVNSQTATRCASVRAAILLISETIATLPFLVYRRTGEQSRERDRLHPVYTLIHDRANGWTPASEFREQMTRDAMLHDAGGIAFINRVRGRPVELIRFEPGAISVEYDAADGSPIYKRNDQNGGVVIPRDNIFHLKAPGGRAPITDGKEAIALSLACELYAARLFSRGGRPGGILKFPNKLGAEVAERIRKSWQNATSGEGQGGTAVIEEGGDFIPLAFKSTDAEFSTIRLFSVNEIGRVFRVNPIFLGEMGRATWANSAEMGRQFLTYTLAPWLVRWEAEATLKLFDGEERQSHFAEFLTDAITRADLKTRAESYAQQIAARILSPNEARAAEGRPPYDGGDKFANPNIEAAANE